MWKDGCLACMCINQGNDSWCDGKKSDYYDKYFEENGENPFGDSNKDNRKCNEDFRQYGVPCGGIQYHNWQCESGLECYGTCDSSYEIDYNCDPMKSKRYDGCQDKDCASTNWENRCLGCMCYHQGNDSLRWNSKCLL